MRSTSTNPLRGSGPAYARLHVCDEDENAAPYAREAFGFEPADAELYALRKQLQWTTLYLRVVLVGLAVVVVVVVGLLLPRVAPHALSEPLVKTPVPLLGSKTVVFQSDERYHERPSVESNKAWDELLPDGRGFVYVPDWKDYNYPPGQNTSWGMIYSTSLFHQIHCLGQIRSYTWSLLESIEKNDTGRQLEMVDMLVGSDGGDHLHHCFDYLRQGIQCAGDMSIEWPRMEPTGERFAVDGWGIPHECKSWSQIMQYMDKNHFNHSYNHDIAPH